MVLKARQLIGQLLVLTALGIRTHAFVHPRTDTFAPGLVKTAGVVPSLESSLTHRDDHRLVNEQRKSTALNEGLSFLDQIVTSAIFAAGVYATIQKADKGDAPLFDASAEGEPVTVARKEPAAVVGQERTTAPAPSPAKSPVAVTALKETEGMESPDDSDSQKESGRKRRLAGKVAKKLIMPWRSFDDL